jgi:hypothetical protein
MASNEIIPSLDPGIARVVKVLQLAGVETFESCEGGPGHAFAEPTVRFYGDQAEGFRAFAVAIANSLQVSYLRRIYSVQDGELVGPHWELVFIVDPSSHAFWMGLPRRSGD